LNFLEAASGFEPLYNGFAVRKGTFHVVLQFVTGNLSVNDTNYLVLSPLTSAAGICYRKV
jgi:hypothetical protein